MEKVQNGTFYSLRDNCKERAARATHDVVYS